MSARSVDKDPRDTTAYRLATPAIAGDATYTASARAAFAHLLAHLPPRTGGAGADAGPAPLARADAGPAPPAARDDAGPAPPARAAAGPAPPADRADAGPAPPAARTDAGPAPLARADAGPAPPVARTDAGPAPPATFDAGPAPPADRADAGPAPPAARTDAGPAPPFSLSVAPVEDGRGVEGPRTLALAPVERGLGRVLLPAYLGVSPLEGSGVFDPVAASGLGHAFYRVDERLAPDLAHVAALLAQAPCAAVLVIHYFGAPAPGTDRLYELAHARGAVLVEDCAHVTPCAATARLGAVGDHALYSLHKVLPVPTGGYLEPAHPQPLAGAAACAADVRTAALAADWEAIARARVANYAGLAPRVAAVPGVRLFWPELPAGTVPHTLPILVERADRFAVYRRMRDAGVGVVALYHTLVPAITPAAFPAAHAVSARILNLPIQQDVTTADHATIAEVLRSAVGAG